MKKGHHSELMKSIANLRQQEIEQKELLEKIYSVFMISIKPVNLVRKNVPYHLGTCEIKSGEFPEKISSIPLILKEDLNFQQILH